MEGTSMSICGGGDDDDDDDDHVCVSRDMNYKEGVYRHELERNLYWFIHPFTVGKYREWWVSFNIATTEASCYSSR